MPTDDADSDRVRLALFVPIVLLKLFPAAAAVFFCASCSALDAAVSAASCCCCCMVFLCSAATCAWMFAVRLKTDMDFLGAGEASCFVEARVDNLLRGKEGEEEG